MDSDYRRPWDGPVRFLVAGRQTALLPLRERRVSLYLGTSLDPATKHPSGAAFSIRHFHTSRRSLATVGDPLYIGLSVAVDKLVFSMTERTGNIWMT